jgi:hypothetical protein
MGVKSGGRRSLSLAVVLIFAGSHALPAAAAASGAGRVVPLHDGGTGVTCRFFNQGARIPWKNRPADWIDASGSAQGDQPFATARGRASTGGASVEWDVTALAKRIVDGALPDGGFVIARVRGSGGRGEIEFHSREAEVELNRPVLDLELLDGRHASLPATADSHVDCSTTRSAGRRLILRAGGKTVVLIRFDLSGRRPGDVVRATLKLRATNRQQGAPELGIFLLDAPRVDTGGSAQMGLAAKYPGDAGIARDPAVVVAMDFESPDWKSVWTVANGKSQVVGPVADAGFVPLRGHALQVRIGRNGRLGADLQYDFKPRIGSEPEEMYFRYYLRFGETWGSRLQGGKLPGFAGTYGVAGWGGERSDGTNGWSMRGGFAPQADPENPLVGTVTIGSYAYHADMGDFWGEHWPWMKDYRGILEKNRWYCIEQYVKLNTPGSQDGVLRAWVDGRLAFERTDIRYRNVPSLKIENLWFNVYFGGQTPSPYPQHLFADNLVIARKYIGPMAPPSTAMLRQ